MKKKPSDTYVLIVDNDQYLRELIAFDFESAGYNVLQAENGNDAFQVFQNHPIDAVVSDLRMENGSGKELLHKIKASPKGKTSIVIFITGYGDYSIEDAFDHGAEGYFLKPFGRRILIQEVDKLLTPVELRWTKQVSEEPTLELREKLSSIRLGRCGFFQPMKADFPAISTLVNFEWADANSSQKINGLGVVRWVRGKSSDSLSSGIGVEILQLSESSIFLVSNLIAQSGKISFIPRG